MMKKIILFSLLAATTATLNSCGGEVEATTVELKGHVKAMTLNESPIVVSVGQYTDNYTSEDIEGLVFAGKKTVQVEVYVKNNGKNDVDLPVTSFTLSDGKKNFDVNSLISLKLDGYSIYDGDVGSRYTKGFIFFDVDEDTKVENLSLNVRNTLKNNEHLGSIPLKQITDVKMPEENTEVSLTKNSIEIEDIVFNGKGTLTVDKVIENYTVKGEDEKLDAPYTQSVRVEYTITSDEGTIYCSTSDFKLKSTLLVNPEFADSDELESGSLKAGEKRSGHAIFSIPTGETGFTFEYKGESSIKLK